jgi:mRNA-degrading endonuclease RelE of RelBE toxin-antitoxin system
LRFSDQVVDAIKGMHPSVRKDVRRVLGEVNAGKKRDIAAVTGEFAGFWRLRVEKHRVVFRYDDAGDLVAEFRGREAPSTAVSSQPNDPS